MLEVIENRPTKQENVVDISEKSWNQIEEYIWKWSPILLNSHTSATQ
jgi:hypothetical protein